MTTEDGTTSATREVVERYSRPTRWLHAGVYLTVLVLMATGVWLLVGNEGVPSPLSRLAGMPDSRLHVWVGWAFTGLVALGVLFGARAAVGFVVESLRYRRSDLAWFRRWPAALVTGRFRGTTGTSTPANEWPTSRWWWPSSRSPGAGSRWRCCTEARRSSGWCRCTECLRTC